MRSDGPPGARAPPEWGAPAPPEGGDSRAGASEAEVKEGNPPQQARDRKGGGSQWARPPQLPRGKPAGRGPAQGRNARGSCSCRCAFAGGRVDVGTELRTGHARGALNSKDALNRNAPPLRNRLRRDADGLGQFGRASRRPLRQIECAFVIHAVEKAYLTLERKRL